MALFIYLKESGHILRNYNCPIRCHYKVLTAYFAACVFCSACITGNAQSSMDNLRQGQTLTDSIEVAELQGLHSASAGGSPCRHNCYTMF